MTRLLRALPYDNDPQAITRPDIVPAKRRFAGASASSPGLDVGPLRELAPYPAMSLPFDEATVAYAALQRVPSTTPSDAAERLASDLAAPPRSGTRHRLDSTVPPPRRPRPELEPSEQDSARREQPPQPKRQASAPEAPRAAPRRKSRALLAAALTALVAALLGANLGNGSLAVTVERLHGPELQSEPLSLPLMPTRAGRPSVAPTLATPRPAAASTPSEIPVVRFQDLPPAEQAADEAKRQRRSSSRRP